MRWYKCCSPVTLCLHGESRTISRLTEARATRAKLPQTGQAFEWCSEIGGFGCRLLYTGVRSWIVQLRYQSKTHRITLGKIGTLPFEGPIIPVPPISLALRSTPPDALRQPLMQKSMPKDPLQWVRFGCDTLSNPVVDRQGIHD